MQDVEKAGQKAENDMKSQINVGEASTKVGVLSEFETVSRLVSWTDEVKRKRSAVVLG